MSGSEEKKLNSLHEEDSLYKAQGGKAAYQISPLYGLRIVSTFLSGRYGRSSCWNGWNCPVLSAGRTDGTVQEKPGKGESNLSSQPFTLHFSPLFSREG